MSLTFYLLIFIFFFFYACRGERQWVLATLGSSFFEAASPILVNAGGRVTGFQSAYLLLPIGVIHLYGAAMRESRMRALSGQREPDTGVHILDRADGLMIMLTIVGVAGAILLPRLFSGEMPVTQSSLGYSPLAPSSKNYIQATYMVANAFLYFLVSRSIGRGVVSLTECLRVFAIWTWVVIGLGVYQVLGSFAPLPWPNPIINSNLAYAQLFSQRMLGIFRMSSTYTEPSVLAMHFVGLFALYGAGLRRFSLAVALLFCLLISTSATAYAGLALFVIVYVAWTGKTLTTRTLAALLFLSGIAFVLVLGMQSGWESFSLGKLVAAKMQSSSGENRSFMDLVALEAFVKTMGLGVGIGSTRASSFLVTFAACTGIPGLLCLGGFLYTLIRKGQRSDSPEMRALALGCLGFIGAWIISVPDLTDVLIWLMLALLRAGAVRTESDELITALARRYNPLLPA